MVGRQLSKRLNVEIQVESMVVLNWRRGQIRVENASIRRGPKVDPTEATCDLTEEEIRDVNNFTQFKLKMKQVDLKISIKNMLEGRRFVSMKRHDDLC